MLLNTDALIAIRKAGGDSLQTLAARTGVSKNSLSAIEQGRTRPRVSTICKLADALSVPVGAITHPNGQEAAMLGGEGSGRKSNEKDEQTMRELRDAVREEDREGVEESERKAKDAFRERKGKKSK